MEIVFDFPPIYDEIRSVFPIAGRGVIFAWGNKIYNPSRVSIPLQLIAHERVHGRRQGRDVHGWWRRYLDEKEFRLTEEIAAHIVEMEYLLGPNPNRQMRRQIIRSTAKRLANPLYRYGISRAQAQVLLKRQLAA
ncbi:hypothetical protein LCGC14_2547850 [marine sediment metagenome]|uniref:DUF4157 domain-containing protein n=1 Tax=marine sediment metagenome TaxID=412755 RepID=A0A0F9ANS9_9ZZZZ